METRVRIIKKVCLAALFLGAGLIGRAQGVGVELLGRLEYPGKMLNAVCGYYDRGKEYALVGTDVGLSVVDVTAPDAPFEVYFLPLVNSIWRAVATYGHYAYVVHGAYNGMDFAGQGAEADGLTILDLNTLDQETPKTVKWKIPGVYETAHNLYIDQKTGKAYLFGIQERKGALILDLSKDPENPGLLGEYNGTRTSDLYIHDGIIGGNYLYGCADKRGVFMIVDISDPSRPREVNSVETPNRMTHNAWLSSNGKVLFTTDEKVGAFITAFDISDKKNVRQIGKIRAENYDHAIPHNAVVKGDYIFTSYYSEGLKLYDATYPDNMVEVASYKTTDAPGGQFEGSWGVYPYLPSGNVLVSDTGTGLHIVRPEYRKGAYFTGRVSDDKGAPVFNAEVCSSDGDLLAYTDMDGVFRTASAEGGMYSFRVNAGSGYSEARVDVNLENGRLVTQNVVLNRFFEDDRQLMETYVRVYPNPFYEDRLLNVDYSFAEGIQREAYLLMLDINGREVYREQLKTNEGIILVGKELPAGVYFVKIFNGTSYSKVFKVLKGETA